MMTESFVTAVLMGSAISVVSTICFTLRRPPARRVSNDPQEGRSMSRFGASYTGSLQVLDDASGKRIEVRIVNLSENGARLHLGAALPIGAPVRLRIPKIGSAATGYVRNCSRRLFGYRIGVEFNGVLYKTSF